MFGIIGTNNQGQVSCWNQTSAQRDRSIDYFLDHSYQSTPLLLSATSGALDACKCLVLLGANIAYKDTSSNTVIHLAVSYVHTNIIEYFIQLNNPLVPTWRILVGNTDYSLFIDLKYLFDYVKI